MSPVRTHRYNRKPFAVDAIRITKQNFEDVRAWCNGSEVIKSSKDSPYFKVAVKRPISELQTRAHVGDWILHTESGFKVYTDKAFKQYFQPAQGVHIVNHPAGSVVVTDEPKEMTEELPLRLVE